MTGNQNNNNSNNRNRRRFTQRKRGNTNKNTTNGNQNNNPPKNRELKFYLHDLVGRKQSESFGKIKEAIILKIQKTFNDPIDLVTSLEPKTKKVYTEPQAGAATTVGLPAARAQ